MLLARLLFSSHLPNFANFSLFRWEFFIYLNLILDSFSTWLQDLQQLRIHWQIQVLVASLMLGELCGMSMLPGNLRCFCQDPVDCCFVKLIFFTMFANSLSFLIFLPYQGSFSSTASFSSHLLLKMITIKKDSLEIFLQNMVCWHWSKIHLWMGNTLFFGVLFWLTNFGSKCCWDYSLQFINIVEAIYQLGLGFEGWLIKRKCSSWGESMCWELFHILTDPQSLNNWGAR